MTDRLYYNDPYSREFDATIVRVGTRDGRTVAYLDRSAFYPTSGGQPFDTGTLSGIEVLDVFEDDLGEVAHVIAAPAAVGQQVLGAVAWDRRFDHMQQHTGQHLLSAAFARLFEARTVGFHLGAEASTVDLSRELTPQQIGLAEDEANRVVWENRPVNVRYATAAEARSLSLRKAPTRAGTLRLIEVDDFDLSACGGTHVSRTGAVGLIAVPAWERFKGGLRVEFVCGGRALRRLRALRDTTVASVRLLSVLPDELPAAIAKLQADSRAQRHAALTLQTELAACQGEALAANAVDEGEGAVVARVVEGDVNQLKALASAVVARPGYIVGLISSATPAAAVVARSADLEVSAKSVIATVTAEFGGRGGGRDDFAQAGGLLGEPDVIVNRIRQIIVATSRQA